MEKEQEQNFDLEQIAGIISNVFNFNPLEFELTKTKEYLLFKKQKKIKPYKEHRIFSIEEYKLLEELHDDNEPLLNWCNYIATRKIGKATYQFCCEYGEDGKAINYFLLEMRLDHVNVEREIIPINILIKYSYPERRVEEIIVSDKNYDKIEHLAFELEKILMNKSNIC